MVLQRPILLAMFLLFAGLASVCPAERKTIFTYRAPESDTDKRYAYDNALLKLALDKTKDTWGEYELVPSRRMNFARAVASLQEGELPNPMFKLSARSDRCQMFAYAPFPVDLGIVGYRIFFTSENIKDNVAKTTSLEQLAAFTMGQGKGWADVEILQKAGFYVTTSGAYERLFFMTAANRFDLFPRGVNEIKTEYEAHKHIPGFAIEPNMVLYYPLPRFFFTNKDGEKAAQRVYEGLMKAYEDGSLTKLWKEHYQESIDFVDLNSRRVFEINNPILEGVNQSYEPYMYKIQ